MFSLYCNNCFRIKQFDVGLEFYLNRCGHILCKECMKCNVCIICKKPWKPTLIDRYMPEAMRELFEDPLKMYARFQKVAKFQREQNSRFLSHFNEVIPAQIEKIQKESNGLRKLHAHLDQKCEQKQQRIAKLRAYLSYHNRKFGGAHDTSRDRDKLTDSGCDFRGSQFSSNRPSTISISDGSHVTSISKAINSKQSKVFTSTRNSNDFTL